MKLKAEELNPQWEKLQNMDVNNPTKKAYLYLVDQAARKDSITPEAYSLALLNKKTLDGIEKYNEATKGNRRNKLRVDNLIDENTYKLPAIEKTGLERIKEQGLWTAGKEGFKDALKERFMRAYFDENLHLNDVDVLSNIMAEYDWTAEKTNRIINDDSIAYAVKQEIAHYQQRGVNSVPFFIINDKYGISGAQPPEAFLEAFKQIAPLKIIANGDSCDPTTGIC